MGRLVGTRWCSRVVAALTASCLVSPSSAAGAAFGWRSLMQRPRAVVKGANGAQYGLFGKGPPVIFSSGLFGTMPWRLYTDFFKETSEDVTLVVPLDARPVTADVVEDAASTLRVRNVGFFGHSSFDGRILESPVVHRASFCDPVCVPSLGSLVAGEPAADAVAGKERVVVHLSELSTPGAATVPIPDFLLPKFAASDAVTYTTHENVGHADLLDDRWADMAPIVFPWMNTVVEEVVPFDEWYNNEKGRHGGAANADHRTTRTRAAFRSAVARSLGDAMASANPANLMKTPPATF